jgi:hypothetical protein
MRSSSFIWKQAWRTADFHGNAILCRETFTKSRIVAVIALALVLPTLGVAVWLGVTALADMSQQSPIPSPVLTAPAFLEATAGESIFLPIALDGTDGVPAIAALLSQACHRGARCLTVDPLAIQDGSWNGTK